MRGIIDRIIAPLGRRIDESTPMVDARLPDGSRINAIIPPLSLRGPMITIRKFTQEKLETGDLLRRYSSLSQPMVDFLHACVLGRKNMIVSGGTGAGKTTLLNVLSEFIPDGERIITIEDAAELKLKKSHWGAPGVPPTQRGGQRTDHHSGPVYQLSSHASGPDRHWRMPRAGNSGHASGDEHGA